MNRLVVLVVTLGGCQTIFDLDEPRLIDAQVGDARRSDGGPSDTSDPNPDTSMMFVQTVTCGGPGSYTDVGISGIGYVPSTYSINVNDIVRFTTDASHNVTPHPTQTTDPGLTVGFSQVVCKQFTVAGTFNYQCGVHGFTGVANVGGG